MHLMRFHYISLIFLFYLFANVFAKGGGGGGRGGGGGGGGGSSGGRGSSGGSRSGSSGSRGGAPSTARSPGGGIAAGGGSGSFKSPPSYSASTSKQTYNNYNPTYNGAYGTTGRYSGYYGTYHSGFPYFFVFPSFMYMGYYGAYHRYNNQGAYYAPEMSSQGTGSTNILINGTSYANDNDNFHYTINVTARSDQFATIDMSYFASSDLNAHPADFIYRLTMAHIVEYDDVNNNGFYDAQEPILSITSLQRTNWQPMVLNNRTVPTNTQQTYLETVTAANVTYNNTDASSSTTHPTFGISMTLRATNLQLNGTASIPLQPNSIQYDVQLQNFPRVSQGMQGARNPRVSLAQVVTTKPFTNTMMDVNVTTPSNIAQQTKTNITYGASVGNYSEGRLEYQPTVIITNMAGISTSTWTNLMDPAQVNRANDPNTWGWGDTSVDARTSTMFLVTFNNGNSNSSYQLSGLAYLDTDIINSAINAASSPVLISSSSKIITGLSVVLLLVLSL